MADVEDTAAVEPGPCFNPMNDAIVCISEDPTCTACFDVPNIPKTFEEDTEMAFRTTNAFVPPNEAGFCDEANYQTCKPLLEGDMVRTRKYYERYNGWFFLLTHTHICFLTTYVLCSPVAAQNKSKPI
jgi:hypothetical protein